MKLVIDKEKIISGLQAVQNIVTTRSTMPILSNVLLRADGDQLELTATDLDVSISCAVPAKVATAGAATVPAKRFFGIIRELPAPEIELEFDEHSACKLQAGASYYRINGLSADDFPIPQSVSEGRKVVLPQDKVRSMLRKTGYAVSNEEARYVLNGIFVSIKEHKMTMVATDGRRLALAEEDVDVPVESQSEFIIPSKTIVELNRLLQSNGNVEMTFAGNIASMNMTDDKGFTVLLITKLVEGIYPNYRQVIPPELKKRVALGREELMQALHRIEFITSEKSNSVKLVFGGNKLLITANSIDVGEAREVLAINYSSEDTAIAFNPSFLLDPLKVLEEDEVFLEFSDDLSPGMLKVNGPFLYVLMPMRTN